MPRRLVSWSELETFLKCERQYYETYTLKAARRESIPMLVGQTYHAVLQDVWTSPLTHDLLTSHKLEPQKLADAGIQVESLANEIPANLVRLFSGPFKNLPRKPLRTERYFRDYKRGFHGVIDVEWDFALETDDNGQVEAVVDGRMVLDYKILSGTRRRSQRDATFSPQLALYAIVSGATHAGFVEIPRNTDKDIRVRVVKYTEAELRHWESWLLGIRAALLRRGRSGPEAFYRCERSNPLCSPMYCDHYTKCYPNVT